jgi:heterodisulfide reductase subunit B
MKYIYYPGCSLEGTARAYDLSVRSLMAAVGAELIDLNDWTCCGASAAHGVSRMLSFALPARNLALAERMEGVKDILAPCSACYLNLQTVARAEDPDTLEKINTVLAEEGLHFSGSCRVRHLLDVLVNDIGADLLRKSMVRLLSNLAVAPYYGCQCLRPFSVFDDPEAPRSMEPLIEALGASVYPWDMGGKCCGAANMNTCTDVGLTLSGAILKAASGADAIVTVCPMCQMNLEAYQNKIAKHYGASIRKSVLYFPQLIGLALGIGERELGLHLNLTDMKRFHEKPAEEVEEKALCETG